MKPVLPPCSHPRQTRIAVIASRTDWLGLAALATLAGALNLLPACATAQSPEADAPIDTHSGEQAREIVMALVSAMVEQGLITPDKAQALVQAAQAKVARAHAPAATGGAAQVAPPSTHVQYVPEIVKKQLREDIRRELVAQAHDEGWATPGAVPSWVSRITWSGDLRLRYQREQFAAENTTTLPNFQAINQAGSIAITNPFLYTDGAGGVSPTRDRLLLRARLGAQARVSDSFDAGVRLSTGNTSDPVTTNQTLGNYEARYQVVLDRAWLHGRLGEQVEFWGGRINNPFWTTELMWAPELGLDGLAAKGTWPLGNAAQVHATLGIFPLQELATTRHDKWLSGAQASGEWQWSRASKLHLGLGWFGYRNISGQLNDTDLHTTDWTAPAYLQKGNTLYNIRVSSSDPNAALYALAGDYRLVNLNAAADFGGFGAQHLVLTGDWVHNFGWNPSAVAARTGGNVSAQTHGYLIKLAYGAPEVSHRGDWQVYGSYRRVEADAVLDAYTETEFHLGGTNAKGYVLGLSYALDEQSVLGLRWQSADEVTGPPLAIDLLQIELNLRF